MDGSFLYSNLDLSNCLKKVVSLWVRLRAQDYGRVAFGKAPQNFSVRGSAKFRVILLTEKLQGASLSAPKSKVGKEELAFLFPPCSSGHAFPRKRGKAK